MTVRLDPVIRPVAALALAEVFDDPNQHLDSYLADATPQRSLDYAEAGGVGVDLVPEIVGIVEQAWSWIQQTVAEHPHFVNIGEGALGNALYAKIVEMRAHRAGASSPPATGLLKPPEVEAITRKIARPLVEAASRR